MEPFVPEGVEALSAGGGKSGAAGTGSPAGCSRGRAVVSTSQKTKCQVEMGAKPKTVILVFTFSRAFWIQQGTD